MSGRLKKNGADLCDMKNPGQFGVPPTESLSRFFLCGRNFLKLQQTWFVSDLLETNERNPFKPLRSEGEGGPHGIIEALAKVQLVFYISCLFSTSYDSLYINIDTKDSSVTQCLFFCWSVHISLKKKHSIPNQIDDKVTQPLHIIPSYEAGNKTLRH